LAESCKILEEKGFKFVEDQNVPKSGRIVKDPDNYFVEIIERGSKL